MAKGDGIPGVENRSVMRGDCGQRQNAQVVLCRWGQCRAELPVFNSSRTGFSSIQAVRRYAENHGWQFASSTGKHACPKCLAAFKATTKRKKEGEQKMANAPRESTVEDRGKINIELAENYDMVNKRYMGTCTDQEIAKKLKCPRKWVSDVREFGFGPTGANDEMERVASSIGKLAHDVEKAGKKAFIAAEECELLTNKCNEMMKDVADVKASVGPQAVKSA